MKELRLGFTLSAAILSTAILAAAILGSSAVPALALRELGADSPPRSLQEQSLPDSGNPNLDLQETTIPESTSFEVSFPSEVVVDVKQNSDYPLTLPLAQAILDDQGRVVVPEETPVNAMIMPVEGGAQIVAKSIEINGETVPIQALSRVIPETTDRRQRGDRSSSAGSVLGTLATGAAGFLGGGISLFGTVAGLVVNALTSSNSNHANSSHVVQIPEGSVHALTLKAAITLPNNLPANTPSPDSAPANDIPLDNPLSTPNDLLSTPGINNSSQQQVN